MRLLSKYDLFIFDWDHTLTTSTLLITMLYLLGRRQKRKHAEELRRMRPDDFSARNIELRENVSRLYSLFDDLYSLVFRPKLKPGSIEMIEFLKKNGKKVAIFSDSKTYRLFKEMRALGIAGKVDSALSAESVGFYKPDPTGLLLLLDRFKTSKEKSVYVGDMANDVLTAKLAGVDSCVVADGIDSAATLEKEGPNYSYARLGSLLHALEEGG